MSFIIPRGVCQSGTRRWASMMSIETTQQKQPSVSRNNKRTLPYPHQQRSESVRNKQQTQSHGLILERRPRQATTDAEHPATRSRKQPGKSREMACEGLHWKSAIADNDRSPAEDLAHPHSRYEQTSKSKGLTLKCRPRHTTTEA